jgi:DNA-binding CsgD family transcriptional regulator
MGAAEVDSLGEHNGAIARLDQALSLVAGHPHAESMIFGARSVYVCMAMRLDQSRGDIEAARRRFDKVPPLEPLIDAKSRILLAELVLLDVEAIAASEVVVSEAQENSFDWIASALIVQLIAIRTALGHLSPATAWAEGLLSYALALPHAARAVDAEVALNALGARRTAVRAASGLFGEAERTFNVFALWKLLVASLHQQAIRALPEASDTREELRALAPRMNAAYRSGCLGLDEYLTVLDDETREVSLTPPEAPTLVSLPGLFASAEVAAIGGSLSSAADWLVWLEERLPAEVVTSLEWPVCRRRIEGLLLLRLGDVAAGVERLAAGVRCCEERGDVIEAAIGRVQLAAAAEAAAARLRDEGIDAKRLGDAACRALRRALPSVSRELTAREAQVIGRLAQGKTHREIGQELSLPSRVVGGYAASCYAKLEARNRVEAVRIARELAIV